VCTNWLTQLFVFPGTPFIVEFLSLPPFIFRSIYNTETSRPIAVCLLRIIVNLSFNPVVVPHLCLINNISSILTCTINTQEQEKKSTTLISAIESCASGSNRNPKVCIFLECNINESCVFNLSLPPNNRWALITYLRTWTSYSPRCIAPIWFTAPLRICRWRMT